MKKTRETHFPGFAREKETYFWVNWSRSLPILPPFNRRSNLCQLALSRRHIFLIGRPQMCWNVAGAKWCCWLTQRLSIRWLLASICPRPLKSGQCDKHPEQKEVEIEDSGFRESLCHQNGHHIPSPEIESPPPVPFAKSILFRAFPCLCFWFCWRSNRALFLFMDVCRLMNLIQNPWRVCVCVCVCVCVLIMDWLSVSQVNKF